MLQGLERAGFRLSIDDFGRGYSSLTYLKQFPVDTIKIDRSFTAGLGCDLHDTTIVTAICGLGHALDMQLLAEGVETAEQLLQLQRLGCELGQGYHWSRPLPPAELAAWLWAKARPVAAPVPLRAVR
ncbi:MAG: diguanylate cyclase/phosphodiesterase & domain with sensor(s), partial [Acidimicrobiales bacterium]|nr:diguanylate cyclase/phosphodiesterase & domain with sensor(s) [Acidimicrobiales bacterium]